MKVSELITKLTVVIVKGPIELITCNKCGNGYIPSNFYDIV